MPFVFGVYGRALSLSVANVRASRLNDRRIFRDHQSVTGKFVLPQPAKRRAGYQGEYQGGRRPADECGEQQMRKIHGNILNMNER